jgi:hypothetical protein
MENWPNNERRLRAGLEQVIPLLHISNKRQSEVAQRKNINIFKALKAILD